MEKLSALPETWYIMVTEENKRILQQAKWGLHEKRYNYTTGAFYGNHCGGNYHRPVGTEITIEDFQRFILKETIGLPKTWSIRVTGETAPFLLKWMEINGYSTEHYGRQFKGTNGYSYFNFSNDEGFSEGSHTGSQRYNVISLEDFKRLAFPAGIEEFSEKLPEDYIVRCRNKAESSHVNNHYYHDIEVSHWPYIVCKKEFIKEEGVGDAKSITTNISAYPELPVFEYEKWSKIINNQKETKMKEFRISGSVALQEAFIQECGLPYIGKVSENYTSYPYLGASDFKAGYFTSCKRIARDDKEFSLPTQWEEAKKYVVEYFESLKKPEDLFVPVKAGDSVTICQGISNWNPDMDKFVGKVVKAITATNHYSKIQVITFTGGDRFQWALSDKHYRKATETEITAYKAGLYNIKLGKHKGVVGTKYVEIDGRGQLSFKECVTLYNLAKALLGYTVIPSYSLKFSSEVKTINIGCVEDIPLMDIIVGVEKLSELGLVKLD